MKHVYLATANPDSGCEKYQQRVFEDPVDAVTWLRSHGVELIPPACCNDHVLTTLEARGDADIWEYPDLGGLFGIERMEVTHKGQLEGVSPPVPPGPVYDDSDVTCEIHSP